MKMNTKRIKANVIALMLGLGTLGAQASTNAPSVAQDKKAPVKIQLKKINDREQHLLRYFGNWSWNTHTNTQFYQNDSSASETQFSTCWLTFDGPVIKVVGSKGPNHGLADIYLDGELVQTIDSYSPQIMMKEILFERSDLSTNSQHVLALVVRKERNKASSGCVTELDYVECEKPVNIRAVMKQDCQQEYYVIFADKKPQPDPSKWGPVQDVIHEPVGGVTLKPGVLNDVFERNIAYLNYSFSQPLQINTDRGKGGPLGWAKELPAASDGRLLAGAAGTLRWKEREDMRKIVKTILEKIAKQQRSDGYHNYYSEAESFAGSPVKGWDSERKNFDRKFWTKGLLAAGLAGFPEAYQIVRRFYDWFNASPYTRDILNGKNAIEALDVWQEVYNSPVGKPDDLICAIRYCDQDYWIRTLSRQNPFVFSDYPGERPQGADLLGLLGFLHNYKATGDVKYLNAVTGGWSVYKKYNVHLNGAPAICENNYYPPWSQYLNQHTGEGCGSTFWADLNARLMRLLPEERYAAEVENVLYNVVMSAQDEKGWLLYHHNLEGQKDIPACKNLCCETSQTGLIGKLPAFIYSTAADGLYVHLFAASTINWKANGKNVVVETETKFPYASGVLMTVKEAGDAPMKIRIRVPSWATGKIPVKVNGEQLTVGTPGSYVTLDRTWRSNDKIEFDLPIGFRTVQYTGLEQVDGNLDRYALFWGPILMALEAPLDGIPRIKARADKLSEMLTPVVGQPLQYSVQGQPGLKYLPYWQVKDQTFTCFPIVQP